MIFEAETVAFDNLVQQLAPSFPLQHPPPPPPPSEKQVALQEPTFSLANKQNSILPPPPPDEIQSKSDKNFGSMSMDDFLANIWNSNENQVISESTQDEASAAEKKSAAATEPTKNPQQASFSVPPPICKKTVDEVWSEIHKGQPQQSEANCIFGTLKKQPTLGEMTLEDFLVNAGIVQKSSFSFKYSPSQPTTATSFHNQTSNLTNLRPLQQNYGLGAAMGVGFYTQQNVGNCVPTNALAPYQMFPESNSLVVNGPITSAAAAGKCQNTNTKKRIIDGSLEMVVERRQRRMLKNRESAARSRARRQAYTVELEAELTQLKQENVVMKQVLAEAERKRKQEMALRKHSTKAEKIAEKLRVIKRTVSAPW